MVLSNAEHRRPFCGEAAAFADLRLLQCKDGCPRSYLVWWVRQDPMFGIKLCNMRKTTPYKMFRYVQYPTDKMAGGTVTVRVCVTQLGVFVVANFLQTSFLDATVTCRFANHRQHSRQGRPCAKSRPAIETPRYRAISAINSFKV